MISRLQWLASAAVLAGTAVGCAELEPATAGVSVRTAALSACSGGAGNAFSEIAELQVTVVHNPSTPDQKPTAFEKRQGLGGSKTITIGEIPEGTDEDVTLVGYTDGKPSWFGRRRHVIVNQGQDNPVQLALSKFGGFSCPKADAEYTHRLFPTTTPLGGGKYLIAGGLTSTAAGGAASFVSTEASRKAYIYDAWTGKVTKVASLMAAGRGAHAAVLVRGATKNRVLLIGGTQKLTFDPPAGSGFGWKYDLQDALQSVEVFEYSATGSPADGTFKTGLAGMRNKRVFPTANVVSTDGLTLICAGGQWTSDDKNEYKECEVWDTIADATLAVSNNFLNIYRAGVASAVVQSGEVTQLLFYGGARQGEVAELYTSSTGQRDGVGGNFRKLDVQDTPHSFFPTLTPIGNNRFLLIGGVNFEGASFAAPNQANAHLLTVRYEGSTPVIDQEAVGGLTVGRYFHTTLAPAGNRVVVLGGFTGTDLTATDDIRYYKAGTGLIPPDSAGKLTARGGMGAVLLDNDTMLIAGGISAAADLATDQAGTLEVYTPSNLLPILQ